MSGCGRIRPRGAACQAAICGRSWYAKPACAHMLEAGVATWQDFLWSLDATAHVDPSCLAWALRKMEEAWPEEHLAKLSVNAFIGLWARNVDLVYLMRTSNNQLDGHGCQYRQTFVDAAGKMHWDNIFVTQLFSNASRPDLSDAGGGSDALPQVREDRLPGPAGFAQEVLASGGAAHAPAPPQRHAGLQAGPPQCRGWERVEDLVSAGAQPAAHRSARHREDLARGIVEQLREAGDVVQTADQWVRRNGRCQLDWLVIEEVTQMDAGLWACVALDRGVRFLLMGDFRQLPAVLDSFAGTRVERPLKDLLRDLAGGYCHELTENRRSDDPVHQLASGWGSRGGAFGWRAAGQHPDVCLVLSHAHRVQINERENRRLAPADDRAPGAGRAHDQRPADDASLARAAAGAPAARWPRALSCEWRRRTHNASRWTAGSSSPTRSCCGTRGCHAITYASCQGLTLRGRAGPAELQINCGTDGQINCGAAPQMAKGRKGSGKKRAEFPPLGHRFGAAPFPGRLPGPPPCAKLHRWLAVTDDPPIKPCISRAPPRLRWTARLGTEPHRRSLARALAGVPTTTTATTTMLRVGNNHPSAVHMSFT